LDIKQSIKDLKHVTKVFIISVHNECKEVLYLLEKDNTKDIAIHTANLAKTNQYFDFNFIDEAAENIQYSAPMNYLYEPNSSILKAGAFNCIGNQYLLHKIAPNSHLYTSTELAPNFPGRTFKVKNVINYNLKEFKALDIKQANITCRNFTDPPKEVKKKLKLKDGG